MQPIKTITAVGMEMPSSWPKVIISLLFLINLNDGNKRKGFLVKKDGAKLLIKTNGQKSLTGIENIQI